MSLGEQDRPIHFSDFGLSVLRTITTLSEQVQQLDRQLALERERIRELERELARTKQPSKLVEVPKRLRLLPGR